MNELTKTDELLAFVNKILREKMVLLEGLNDLEKLQIKMSIYNIFEKHHDVEELYYELLDFLENEGIDFFMDEIESYYNSLNK